MSSSCVGGVRMEVPLVWQGGAPLTLFPVDGDDSDDVPPSPTLDPVPATFPAAGTTFFQQGFLDCAQEAVRFLTQEEGMSQDNPVVQGLRRHLVRATPSYTPPHPPSPCLPSRLSQRGRFAPYTVPSHQRGRVTPYTAVSSHHGLPAGVHRRELDKQGLSTTTVSSDRGSLQHKCPASSVPSAHRIQRVLDNDVISADDLQGVLECFQAEPLKDSRSESLQTLSHSQSLTSSVWCGVGSVDCAVAGEGKKSWVCGDLDDSGIIADVSSTDLSLADEVDSGVDRVACTDSNVVSSIVVDSDTAVGKMPPVVMSASVSLQHDSSLSSLSTSSSSSPTVSLPVSLSVTDSHYPDPSSSSSLTVSPPLSSDDHPNSSPSSQLALLSSLSSGTHRLTSSLPSSSWMEQSDATASRIQSLASEILLLLQEEADAQNLSDDDDDNDDDDDDDDDVDGNVLDEVIDSELEDSFELEAEP